MVPVTASVSAGAAFAIPTLPVERTTNFCVAASPFVDVKISTLAFPVTPEAIDLIAAVTRALGARSLVYHSTAPKTVPSATVVSVSVNRIVG